MNTQTYLIDMLKDFNKLQQQGRSIDADEVLTMTEEYARTIEDHYEMNLDAAGMLKEEL